MRLDDARYWAQRDADREYRKLVLSFIDKVGYVSPLMFKICKAHSDAVYRDLEQDYVCYLDDEPQEWH